MKVNLNKLPKSLMEIIVEVEEKELQPFLTSSAYRLQKKKNIPGFRPGQAPYQIVEQYFGKMAILKEALEDILNETFLRVIKENELEIISQPEIEVIKFAPDNPLIYKAKIALLPKIKISKYEKLKEIKRAEIKVEESEIENVIKDLQKMRAKEISVEREIKEGDKVIIDLEMFLNKVPLEGGQSKNVSMIVGDSFYLSDLSKNLVGLKKKETKEFPLKFPEEYYDKKLAGKIIDFRVKVNEIFQIDLPEINDQFAQGFGNFKGLEDLKKQLRENLKEEKRMEEERRIENEICECLIKNSEFEEIPEVLISLETQKMIEELKNYLKNQNLSFEDYLSHLKKTEEEIKDGLKKEAEKRIKITLIIREIAKKEKIEIGEEEIEKFLEENSELTNLEKEMEKEGFRKYLENFLIERRVLDFLKQFIS